MNTRPIDKAGELKQSARELLEELSQLHSKDGELDKSRSMALDLLFELSELEKEILLFTSEQKSPQNQDKKIADEVRKVAKRIQGWAKKPEQKNSKILFTFQKIKKECDGGCVTTEQLVEAYDGDEKEFYANFNQMKTIAERNHGKIFEVVDECVELWEPVADAVNKWIPIVGKDGDSLP